MDFSCFFWWTESSVVAVNVWVSPYAIGVIKLSFWIIRLRHLFKLIKIKRSTYFDFCVTSLDLLKLKS